MRSKVIPAIVLLGFVAAVASAGTLSIMPDDVRTYCLTEPLKRPTDATIDDDVGLLYAPDDNVGIFGGPAPGGNEVVWQVIGDFPQDPPGQGYCGYIGIPPIAIGSSQANYATGIQDCVAAVQLGRPESTRALEHRGGASGVDSPTREGAGDSGGFVRGPRYGKSGGRAIDRIARSAGWTRANDGSCDRDLVLGRPSTCELTLRRFAWT